MGKHLVTIGDLVLDIIMPVTLPIVGSQHQSLTERSTEPGGAANTIITARNLGLDVTVVGTVGSDVYGERILRPVRDSGADCSFVTIQPDTTSTIVVTLTDRESGEHVFLGHYGEGPDVPYPDGLDVCIAQADALFLSGYTLADSRIAAMAQRALKCAYEAGVPIYLDVGPFLNHADQELVRWVLERTHLLFLTDEETSQVVDQRRGPEAYADLLLHGPTYAIVKRGASGCIVVTVDWWLDFPAFPVETVLDTVGAGDAFAAAYIAGVLNGLEIRECALLANATGAASTRKVGAGSNAPTCDEIMAVLEGAGESIDFSC
jgi:ribokinase